MTGKNKGRKGLILILVLSLSWFCLGAFSLAKRVITPSASQTVYMPVPVPCYAPNGDIKSYANDCIGDGAGCDIKDCPKGTSKIKPNITER